MTKAEQDAIVDAVLDLIAAEANKHDLSTFDMLSLAQKRFPDWLDTPREGER